MRLGHYLQQSQQLMFLDKNVDYKRSGAAQSLPTLQIISLNPNLLLIVGNWLLANVAQRLRLTYICHQRRGGGGDILQPWLQKIYFHNPSIVLLSNIA